MYLIQDTEKGKPGTCTSAPMAIEIAREQRDSITLEETSRNFLSTLKKLKKNYSSLNPRIIRGNPTTRFSASKLVYSSLSSANKRNPERGAGEMKGCSLLGNSSLGMWCNGRLLLWRSRSPHFRNWAQSNEVRRSVVSVLHYLWE